MASEGLPACINARSLDRAPERSFLIVGLTSEGRPFRPSDWADRLAGVMSSFQPPGTTSSAPFQFSPYAVPARYGSQTCVRVDPAIARVEPMALSFLFNFARDNDLQIALSFQAA